MTAADRYARRLERLVDAAKGAFVSVTRMEGRWVRIAEEDATRLRDAGRGAEVLQVWLKDPDPQAFATLMNECPELRGAFANRVRAKFRTDARFAHDAITYLRRLSKDRTASPRQRRVATQCLKHHGFDDDSLAREEESS